MNKRILAWHFVGKTLRDGSPIPRNGELLVFKGAPILCKQGYHASLDAFDALKYAPGSILCRVECGGIISEYPDKLVCTERRILARIDTTTLLWYFARQQALSVIQNWERTPQKVVLDYLITGDMCKRSAARIAAWRTAESAAWNAARYAAWNAAESDAESAAWSDAKKAAWSAARTMFNNLMNKQFKE